MKVYIELERTIKQRKKVVIELTGDQIDDLCCDYDCHPDDITYQHVHDSMVSGNAGDKLALNDDGWEDANYAKDRLNWDGCCTKVERDNNTVSEWDLDSEIQSRFTTL